MAKLACWGRLKSKVENTKSVMVDVVVVCHNYILM